MYILPRSPSICLRACFLWASVSAWIKSPSPSTSVKSNLPFRNALEMYKYGIIHIIRRYKFFGQVRISLIKYDESMLHVSVRSFRKFLESHRLKLFKRSRWMTLRLWMARYIPTHLAFPETIFPNKRTSPFLLWATLKISKGVNAMWAYLLSVYHISGWRRKLLWTFSRHKLG